MFISFAGKAHPFFWVKIGWGQRRTSRSEDRKLIGSGLSVSRRGNDVEHFGWKVSFLILCLEVCVAWRFDKSGEAQFGGEILKLMLVQPHEKHEVQRGNLRDNSRWRKSVGGGGKPVMVLVGCRHFWAHNALCLAIRPSSTRPLAIKGIIWYFSMYLTRYSHTQRKMSSIRMLNVVALRPVSHCSEYLLINGHRPERRPITLQFRVALVSAAGTFGHISRNSICIHSSTALNCHWPVPVYRLVEPVEASCFGVLTAMVMVKISSLFGSVACRLVNIYWRCKAVWWLSAGE